MRSSTSGFLSFFPSSVVLFSVFLLGIIFGPWNILFPSFLIETKHYPLLPALPHLLRCLFCSLTALSLLLGVQDT